MVTFLRLMLWFGLFTVYLTFLALAGTMNSLVQMIFRSCNFIAHYFLMGTGGGRKVERIRKRSEKIEAEPEELKEELPAPVQSDVDASSRRNTKLSRSRTIAPEPEPEPEEDEEITVSLADDEVEVSVIDENVHVAEEYVAEIDAESMEEADIESFIDDRRDRHAQIRRRIEARRREQLAEIRSELLKFTNPQMSPKTSWLWSHLTIMDTPFMKSRKICHLEVPSVQCLFELMKIVCSKFGIPMDQGFISGTEPLPELPPLPELGICHYHHLQPEICHCHRLLQVQS